MAKRKPGLHKKVSSIFGGVQMSKSAGSPPQPPTGQQKPQPQQPTGQQKPQSQQPGASAGADKQDGRIVQKTAPQRRTPVLPSGRKQFKFSAPIPGVSDTKTKIKLALIPILLITLIFSLKSTFRTKPAVDKSSTVTLQTLPPVTPQTADKAADTDIDWQVPETYPPAFPDPMVKGRKKYSSADDYPQQLSDEALAGDRSVFEQDNWDDIAESIDIKSILYSEFGRSAVIDNRILYTGDMVSGAVIKKINKNSIEFEKDGKNFTVQLR